MDKKMMITENFEMATNEELLAKNEELFEFLRQSYGDEYLVKDAVLSSFVQINDRMLTNIALQLPYKTTTTCEFEDALQIVKLAFVLVVEEMAITSTNSFSDSYIFLKTQQKSKRMLIAAYQNGGMGLKYGAYQRAIKNGTLPMFVKTGAFEGTCDENVFVTDSSVEKEVVEKSTKEAFIKALNKVMPSNILNDDERSIIVKHAVEGQTFKSISEQSGINYSTVKYMYQNAINRLAKAIRKETGLCKADLEF